MTLSLSNQESQTCAHRNPQRIRSVEGFRLKYPSPLSLWKENETWTQLILWIHTFPVVRVAVSRYGNQSSAKSARKDERLSVRLYRRILVVAISVGFCISISPSQAVAPTFDSRMFANVYPKAYAYHNVMTQWRSKTEYACLVDLWERESHWNRFAHNKHSGAFGIAQFMPETWGNYKLPYKPVDASVQITGGLRYIYKRYGSPCKAWSFWQRQAKRGNAWY